MTICIHENCNKKATFNLEGKKATFCAQHKSANMIDVLNKKCECNSSQPRWNFPGLQPQCCIRCKQEGMIEIHRKKCFCGKVRPVFNYEGLKAEFCNSCKSENMINVIDERCFCKQHSSPSFNYEGLRPKYCFDCKLPNMINVRTVRCECGNSRRCFNFEGLKPLYCSKCKQEGMVDLLHNLCMCGNAQPSFNFENLPARYCVICKKPGMVTRNKLCFCGLSQPTFNYEGLKATHCFQCKKENMVDVIHAKCKTHLCDTRPQKKFDGYCCRCFIYMFPELPVAKNYKTKEFAVAEFVKSQFPNFTWITDKKVQDGCSLKRPDLLLDLGYQVIIVEVDENQHNKYDCSCENKRLMQISQDLGHRPIIFIRFNPDNYINENNVKVRSCWSVTKLTGIVKIEHKNDWRHRLDCLKNEIYYWTRPENITNKTLEVVQLFFDQNLFS